MIKSLSKLRRKKQSKNISRKQRGGFLSDITNNITNWWSNSSSNAKSLLDQSSQKLTDLTSSATNAITDLSSSATNAITNATNIGSFEQPTAVEPVSTYQPSEPVYQPPVPPVPIEPIVKPLYSPYNDANGGTRKNKKIRGGSKPHRLNGKKTNRKKKH